MNNNYQLASVSDAPWLRREFESPAFDEWLERLSGEGFCQLLVSLFLKLERMLKAPLDARRILDNLQRLTVLVRDVAEDLPPPQPSSAAAPMTLAQRLCSVTYRNLKRNLTLLDHSAWEDDQDAARGWLVAEMFACLSHQIALGALRGPAWPARTWQELHDLFVYVDHRLAPLADSPMRLALEVDYRRALIVGLLAQGQAHALLSPASAAQLTDWACASSLQDPRAYYGEIGVCLVQTTVDEPPCFVPRALGTVGPGWVLKVPQSLLAAFTAP
jgi:hypothetical protein